MKCPGYCGSAEQAVTTKKTRNEDMMILADCECGGAEADYIPVNRCLCVEKVVWTLQQMTGNHGVTLTGCSVQSRIPVNILTFNIFNSF